MIDPLFGKYCYIDTPWIAGEKTVYRIIRSGVRSNSWCEVPINGRTKKVNHGVHSEDIVFVVLDTLIDEDTKIMRVALKDIEIIGEADPTEPQTCANGCKWLSQDGECTEPHGECHIEYRTEVDEPQTLTAEEKAELLDAIGGGEFFPKDEPQTERSNE